MGPVPLGVRCADRWQILGQRLADGRSNQLEGVRPDTRGQHLLPFTDGKEGESREAPQIHHTQGQELRVGRFGSRRDCKAADPDRLRALSKDSSVGVQQSGLDEKEQRSRCPEPDPHDSEIQ